MIYSVDKDASEVLEAVRSTGVIITQEHKNYVHFIIRELRYSGVWDKIKAMYGFVGGTASSHKWNWKDLRDLDVAYRLTFPNGMTHNSNGIQGNGTNQYARTFFIPSTNFVSKDNLSFAINVKKKVTIPNWDFGSANNTGAGGGAGGLGNIRCACFTDLAYSSGMAGADVRTLRSNAGYSLVVSRTNSSNYNIMSEDLKMNIINTSVALNSIELGIMTQVTSATGFEANPSDAIVNFVCIGDGLTNIELEHLYNTMTFAQKILGRFR